MNILYFVIGQIIGTVIIIIGIKTGIVDKLIKWYEERKK